MNAKQERRLFVYSRFEIFLCVDSFHILWLIYVFVSPMGVLCGEVNVNTKHYFNMYLQQNAYI